MAAYYTRQRLPPPTESFIEELGVSSQGSDAVTSRRQPPTRSTKTESFLIFPEPTAAASKAPVRPPPTPIILNPPSPSASSSSLPPSLIASVNARRSDSQGHSASARSLSRGRPESSSAGEWEDLATPAIARSLNLSTNSGTLRPSQFRGRRPTSTTALVEARGSGWEWTLDREDDVDMAMLLSWQRLAGATSPTPSVGSNGGMGEAESSASRYVDAASQFHEESLLDEVWATVPVAASVPRSRVNAVSVSVADSRPRRISLRLASPWKEDRRVVAPTSSPLTQDLRHHEHSQASFVKLPFSMLLNAILSIDTQTTTMLETDQTPSLFGLSEPLAEEMIIRDRQLKQLVALSDTSAQATDRNLLSGFRATHLMNTNPFTFPLYLLGLGWSYGLKAWNLSEPDDTILEVSA